MLSPELTFLLPLGIALAGAVAVLSLDAWGSRRASVLVAGLALLVAAVASVAGSLNATGSIWDVFGVGRGFAAMMTVVLVPGALALLGGLDELSAHPRGGVLAALGVLAVAAASAAPLALDYAALLLCVETASLCAYAIVALGRTHGASEAAMKYFIQGSVATGLLALGGAIFVGAVAGSTSYDVFLSSLSVAPAGVAAAGVLLVAVGLSFKAGAFPFHSWVPDAYEMAPSAGAGVLAASVKAGAVLSLSILMLVLAPVGVSPDAIAAIALGSIVFGNLAALKQRSYARMLAYSGIAQVGYALVAVTAKAPVETAFIVATYAVAVAGAFAAAAAFKRVDPEWDGSIAGLAGMGARSPLVSACLAVILLSLVGVPPLFGFWGKLYAFQAAIATGWTWLALAGLLGSVVSFAYYGGVLRSMYFDEPADASGAADSAQARSAGSAGWAVIASSAIIAIGGVGVLIAGAELIAAAFAPR